MSTKASSTATWPSPSSWTLIADSTDGRVDFLQAALASCSLPLAAVVDYRDLLAGRLASLERAPRGSVVRIESPGRAADIYLALLKRGGAPAIGRWETGRILYPRLWYAGFRDLLRTIRDTLSPREVRFTSAPDDICLLFDKEKCHAYLESRGVRVAPSLGRSAIESFDELRERMVATGRRRVFVKLNHGSSASGVLAYETSRRGEEQAFTTVEAVRTGESISLYNNRRIRTVRDRREIAAIVNELCRHGVHVETWVPKAGIEGYRFDLRILAIGGEPAHVVTRMSEGPMTNLHLRNRRGDAESVRRRMTASGWEELLATCRRVANAFPRTLSVGLDVAVPPGFRSHVVLEVNAFGDLLKGVLDRGMTTYEAQVRAVLMSEPGC